MATAEGTGDTVTLTVPRSMGMFIQGVVYERWAQDEQWGVSNHDPILWSAIISKHVGRINADALDALSLHGNDSKEFVAFMQFTQRLIVVAAVCCAAAESMNRAEWS